MQTLDTASTLVSAPTTPTADFAAKLAKRDRVIDLARAVAIIAVALGHWLAAVTWYRNGEFGGKLLLELDSTVRPLSWVFQVVPLFFAVGGWSSAASWRSARAKGSDRHVWLAKRMDRVLRPLMVLVATLSALTVVSHITGIATGPVGILAKESLIPMWFLVPFAAFSIGGPWLVEAVEDLLIKRWLLVAGILSVLTILAVDLLRFFAWTPTGWANDVLVWLLCHQIGVAWHLGVFDRLGRRMLGAAASTSLAVAIGMTVFGTWPGSLINVPGQGDGVSAPTVVFVLLGLAHILGIEALRPQLKAAAHHRVLWPAIALVNLRAFTIHLWHFPALLVGTAVLLPLGIMPDATPSSTEWWLLRPVWVAALCIILFGFVSLAARFEAPGAPMRAVLPTNLPLLLATPAAAVAVWFGIRGLDKHGVASPAGFLGLDWATMLPLVLGAVVLASVSRGVRPTEASAER